VTDLDIQKQKISCLEIQMIPLFESSPNLERWYECHRCFASKMKSSFDKKIKEKITLTETTLLRHELSNMLGLLIEA
jgi:hypothetical protein